MERFRDRAAWRSAGSDRTDHGNCHPQGDTGGGPKVSQPAAKRQATRREGASLSRLIRARAAALGHGPADFGHVGRALPRGARPRRSGPPRQSAVPPEVLLPERGPPDDRSAGNLAGPPRQGHGLRRAADRPAPHLARSCHCRQGSCRSAPQGHGQSPRPWCSHRPPQGARLSRGPALDPSHLPASRRGQPGRGEGPALRRRNRWSRRLGLRGKMRGRPAPFPLHHLARGRRRDGGPARLYPRSRAPDGGRSRHAAGLGRRGSLEHRQPPCACAPIHCA